jgi:hypothetical protein
MATDANIRSYICRTRCTVEGARLGNIRHPNRTAASTVAISLTPLSAPHSPWHPFASIGNDPRDARWCRVGRGRRHVLGGDCRGDQIGRVPALAGVARAQRVPADQQSSLIRNDSKMPPTRHGHRRSRPRDASSPGLSCSAQPDSCHLSTVRDGAAMHAASFFRRNRRILLCPIHTNPSPSCGSSSSRCSP